MEPNKPLSTEEKVELEMDKVIEFEQKPMSVKKWPAWLKWGIIILIIIGLVLFFYPKHYGYSGLGDILPGPHTQYTCYGFRADDHETYFPGGGAGYICYGYLSSVSI